MTLSPERRAEMLAKVMKKPKGTAEPKPKAPPSVAKLAAVDGDVVDMPFRGRNGERVHINMAEYERQQEWRRQDAIERRRRQRELDPFNYGHWGPHDED